MRHDISRVGSGTKSLQAQAKTVSAEARRRALVVSPLFQAMRPDELDAIVRLASEKQWPRGATIFQKGDEGSSMVAILSGRVRVSSISTEGREITLSFINAGEVFGEIALLDGKPRSADVVAIEPTHALIVERRVFLPFLKQNEDLFLRMLVVLCERLRQTSLALEEMALFDLPTRLARVLLKLMNDYGRPVPQGIRIDARMSQRDLAALVASSRESVNKQLRQWRADGVLDREAGRIIVFRAEELRSLLRDGA